MHPYPHRYRVTATGERVGDVSLTTEHAESLRSAPPLEFDGPGDLWSPESLLVASVADCFVLTFRGIARGARVSLSHLECVVVGTLERIESVTQFTRFDVDADLCIADPADEEKARQALLKAERTCLIANSLKGPVSLRMNIRIARPAQEPAA